MYVTYAEDGSLDINAYMENGLDEGKPEKAAFHNVYSGEAKYDPPLKKVVDVVSGKAPADLVFTFRMIPADPSYPMPDNKEASTDPSTGALTMDIQGPGSYEFGWMHFDQSHCGNTYVYTVKEIDNGESGYSYDRNIYKLTVKVVPAEEGIALETFITDETGQVLRPFRICKEFNHRTGGGGLTSPIWLLFCESRGTVLTDSLRAMSRSEPSLVTQ